ncbi:ig-like domain-containing surface protein [Mycoplasma sp. CAG:611]|nr:ig-like domain-containing surface protein [Mycoplasma sp. CAG:611]
MSKKFPINFKKGNNNLSIKKEEKNNVDELGLSTLKSNEKEGYSPLNDDMKTHYANINDLINNKKEDIPAVSEEVKEEVGVNNDIDNSNINSNNDIEKTTVVSLDEIDNELDKINKKEQPFFFNNNFMNKNKEEEKKENNNINNTISDNVSSMPLNNANNNYPKEVDYEEENLGFIKNRKINKKLLLIIGIIFFILILGLILYSMLKPGTLNNISLSLNDIVYYGENNSFKVTAIGKNNLRKTKYTFTVNNDIVSMKNENMIGKKVNNSLFAYKLGSFNIEVIGSYKDVSKKLNKNITVCKRLSEESIPQSQIIAYFNEESSLNINLGDDICYKNITFEIEDTSIAEINENRVIKGKTKGYTSLIIKQNNNTFKIDLRVVDKSTVNLVERVYLENIEDSIVMNVNDVQILKPTIIPVNATDKNINFSSSNEKIVSVNNKGEVKALNKGSAKIIVKSNDGAYTNTLNVIVKGSNDTEIETFSPVSVTIKSNNANKNIANVNNLIILNAKFDRKLSFVPKVNIFNKDIEMVCSSTDEPTCIATIKVDNNSTKGKVNFVIKDYKDINDTIGNEVNTTTDSSEVIIK